MKKLTPLSLTIVLSIMLGAMACSADINDELASAVGKNDIQKVKGLIAKGADINAKDNHGTTPLMWASLMQATEAARLLIEKGANVNTKDMYGWTTLMHATGLGDTVIGKILLDKGVDVNAKSLKGDTALSIAKREKKSDMIKLLQQAGAK